MPRPGRFTPGKRPGTHYIGGWVGPRVGLDGCGKSRPPLGLDPRTVQPVASRYTDCAIPALQKRIYVVILTEKMNKTLTNKRSPLCHQ